MAQWAKYLTNKCLHKIQAQWHTSVIPELDEKGDRWISGALWPASLVEKVNSRLGEIQVKEFYGNSETEKEIEENSRR